MEKAGLVSVIVPAYNAEKFISIAIESVLNQTYGEIEIIVIDDGTTDATKDILSKYAAEGKIVFLQHENGINKGVSKTRKLGIENAQGKFIAFLDADDSFLEEKLSKQVAVLTVNPNILMCHTAVNYVAESGLIFPHNFNFRDCDCEYNLLEYEELLSIDPIFNSSSVVRRSVLEEINFSMPQLFQFEDWILWILCAQKGNFYYINEKLANYYFHQASSTAKLHKQKLVNFYSKIEFHLCLLGIIKDQKLVKMLLDDAENNLVALSRHYAENTSVIDKNLPFLFYKDSGKEVYELRNQINNLYKNPVFKWMNWINVLKNKIINR